MNNKLERICKKAVMTCLKVLFLHLPGQTAEEQEKPQLGQPVSS
jgi:hypothetical protein